MTVPNLHKQIGILKWICILFFIAIILLVNQTRFAIQKIQIQEESLKEVKSALTTFALKKLPPPKKIRHLWHKLVNVPSQKDHKKRKNSPNN